MNKWCGFSKDRHTHSNQLAKFASQWWLVLASLVDSRSVSYRHKTSGVYVAVESKQIESGCRYNVNTLSR
uniref:Uncharacterized protein n=1 Tax=Anguilla anguilla TaxID=7936 RepID=A0A0E9WHB1_ANGAN